jgi:hypothetical protein
MAQRGTQRARDATTTTHAAHARAATEALVMPLVQLVHSAENAKMRVRLPRALELYERALALAEASLPPQSTLVIVATLDLVIRTRMYLAAGGGADMPAAARAALRVAAWRSGGELLCESQRCLRLLRERWAAGTLLTPTPEEAYFAECCGQTPASVGAESFVSWAFDALFLWPQEAAHTLADGAQCLHGIHEALCAAVDMWTRRAGCSVLTVSLLHDVLQVALDPAKPWLPRLRDTCRLSHAYEAKLRNLLQAVAQGESARLEEFRNKLATGDARGAADVARHGLRSCALPSCSTTEQYPKTYKLCGRCRGAAYCCAAHSKEDWKRHKREDGCKPAE